MTQDWQDISSAPKDGTPIWARRVFRGKVVVKGRAVWGVMADDAPMRQEDCDYADTPRWLRTNRLYSFPTPTHWLPSPPTDKEPS